MDHTDCTVSDLRLGIQARYFWPVDLGTVSVNPWAGAGVGYQLFTLSLTETNGQAGSGGDAFHDFHGTKADLRVGDLVIPGKNANYGERQSKFVYASSNLNVAIWGAELASAKEPRGSTWSSRSARSRTIPISPTRSFPEIPPTRFARGKASG